MNRLKETEWMLINEILEEIYEIEDSMEFKKRFIKMLGLLIPCKGLSFTIPCIVNSESSCPITSKELDLDNSAFHNLDFIDRHVYNEKYAALDYVFNQTPYLKSTAFKDSDVINEKLRCKTEFYQEYLLKYDVPFPAGIILMKDGQFLGTVNLFRSKEQGDFTVRDIFVLDQFKNHVTNILYRLENKKISNIETIKNNKKFIEMHHISEREIEVIFLITEGLSNSQIAEKLILSESTVKKHTYNIYRKLKINRRNQLIRMINR